MALTTISFWLFVLYQFVPPTVFWTIVFVGLGALWVHASTGMSLRRKTAISTWSPTDSSSIFAKLSVDMTNAQQYLNKLRDDTGTKITITHLLGKALGLALRKHPNLNGRLLFGKFIQNDSVDVCFLVATGGGKNLAPKTIKNIDKKSVEEICNELTSEVSKVRGGKDEEFKKNMALVQLLPTFMLSIVSAIIGFVSGDLGLGFAPAGLKPRNFGCCMVTNVGVFGVEEAYAPFTPFARTPLLVLLGTVTDKPAVKDGKITILPIMKIMATMDHRFIDGADGAQVGLTVKQLLENPKMLEKTAI